MNPPCAFCLEESNPDIYVVRLGLEFCNGCGDLLADFLKERGHSLVVPTWRAVVDAEGWAEANRLGDGYLMVN